MRPYRLIDRVTKGGCGEVWRVLDANGTPRALKKLFDRSPTFVEALRDEVTKLIQLSRVAGVIKVIDYDLESDDPFFVMELAQCSLLDVVNGPMDPVLAAQITLDVIRVVQETHQHGVLHRDVKPDNILLANGAVKLADFGIGKGGASILMTVGGAGTPGYMAPEQHDPNGLSALIDVYGVGATLYHLLTGQRPPQEGADLDPRAFVPSCPAAISGVVRLMTTSDWRVRMPLDHADRALRAFISQQTRFAPKPSVSAPAKQNNGAGLLAALAVVTLGFGVAKLISDR